MKMVTKNTIASSIKYMDEYMKDWVDEFIDRMDEHDRALWDKNCSINLTDFHKLLEDSSRRQIAKYGHKRHEKLLEDMDRREKIETNRTKNMALIIRKSMKRLKSLTIFLF